MHNASSKLDGLMPPHYRFPGCQSLCCLLQKGGSTKNIFILSTATLACALHFIFPNNGVVSTRKPMTRNFSIIHVRVSLVPSRVWEYLYFPQTKAPDQPFPPSHPNHSSLSSSTFLNRFLRLLQVTNYAVNSKFKPQLCSRICRLAKKDFPLSLSLYPAFGAFCRPFQHSPHFLVCSGLGQLPSQRTSPHCDKPGTKFFYISKQRQKADNPACFVPWIILPAVYTGSCTVTPLVLNLLEYRLLT